MRFGPILVPSSIAVAIGVIVAAESGWLDGSNPEPVVIRSESGIHGADPAKTPARNRPSIAATDDMDAATSTGRSVGKLAAQRDATAMPSAAVNGAGGAGLESDGIEPPASPPTAALEPAPADGLQQARDEAAKAKQEVLEVTRASLESQKASEAEFEREKSELNDKIAQLQAKLDAGGNDGGASGQTPRADAVAQAEAKAATAAAELADAHQRENALRTKLAELQAGGGAEVRSPAVDDEATNAKANADARAAAEQALNRAESRAKDLSEKVDALQRELAASKAANAKADAAATSLGEAQQRAVALDHEVAALRTKLASGEAVEARLAAAETQRADSDARAKALGEKIAALTAEAAAHDATFRQVSAEAEAAKPLAAELAKAKQQGAALETQIATLRNDATAGAAARTADTRTIAALQKQLEDSRLREQDLGATIAANTTATGEADKRAAIAKLDEARHRETDLAATIATLRDKLARAGEAAKTSSPGPAAVTDLSRLQDDLAGARRGEATLRKENAVLQREIADARAEAQTVRDEADGASRAHAPSPQGMRRSPPKRGEAIGRGALTSPPRPRPEQTSTRELHNTDDQRLVIQHATALIRAGHLDKARQMLRAAGSPAATRALADTYNPLTNTQYGAIGVDSDADRASFLYQQAARPF